MTVPRFRSLDSASIAGRAGRCGRITEGGRASNSAYGMGRRMG
jgi:hypothetical protein